jgi:membrane fusion protein, copper/silver efflux system
MANGSDNRRRSLGWVLRAIRIRLRFLAALAVAFLIVARWEVLRTYWDRWTAPAARDASMGAVSADTEYFCPMDPGVLSTWPGKCPICFMATVRRPKGDMGPLPSGVVARVQLSPERVLLGGIRSEAVRYRPLAREIRALGVVKVEGDHASITADLGREESSWVKPGQAVAVTVDPPDGSPTVPGKIQSLGAPSEGSTRVVVEVAEPPEALRSARFGSIVARVPLADREPLRSMPRGNPPLQPGEPRALHACAEHPEVVQVEAGRCPRDQKPLERVDLARNQRIGWWCPMHPHVVADRAGSKCGECGGMGLIPRVVTYAPVGEVLAIPESAVIDTGSRTMVYVERMPGMFDGVEVRLGPRSGGYFPVVEGLEPGQAVAASGAFLVDAETRLNPSLAAGYFGATRSESVLPRPAQDRPDLGGLSSLDRDLASSQSTCPVTGKRLGSMGTPIRVVARNRTVFLCCDGCEGALKESPDRYLAKLKPLSPAHHP